MNNIQKRTLTYIQEVVNRTNKIWSRNSITIKEPTTPIFNKRYENRETDFSSKPQPVYKKYENRSVDFSSKPKPVYKKYENRKVDFSSKPKTPFKKYEDDDLWDIHHIQKNGGL